MARLLPARWSDRSVKKVRSMPRLPELHLRDTTVLSLITDERFDPPPRLAGVRLKTIKPRAIGIAITVVVASACACTCTCAKSTLRGASVRARTTSPVHHIGNFLPPPSTSPVADQLRRKSST
ncbi:hypothetical protein JDV02_003719 [Purpureocillium takamizusanense]|uniref:Uncharacterized protein n=1 Tax=Purpureocillium takamizusanense TaxID=2060973 RepID=A0A9Q8V8Q2_9HYPO|nr:uncharacterized protein JDV02_003719 [Purpureocillium takamizusanense]UNI17375.1 hypothetical protein JDV02_003719 [Purpureocillium takamizusanense]